MVGRIYNSAIRPKCVPSLSRGVLTSSPFNRHNITLNDYFLYTKQQVICVLANYKRFMHESRHLCENSDTQNILLFKKRKMFYLLLQWGQTYGRASVCVRI